jgi:hypothetical protein
MSQKAKTETRKPKATVAKKDIVQRLRIRVRAYEYKILDTSVLFHFQLKLRNTQ